MQDAVLTLSDAVAAGEGLALRTVDGSATFTFDTARYDEAADRLLLNSGPPTAGFTELTPEGHVVRISAPDQTVCELVLTDVRRRLLRDGRLQVTLGDRRVVVDAGTIAELLTRRPSAGRFARRR